METNITGLNEEEEVFITNFKCCVSVNRKSLVRFGVRS
jgi:hypothetical protein